MRGASPADLDPTEPGKPRPSTNVPKAWSCALPFGAVSAVNVLLCVCCHVLVLPSLMVKKNSCSTSFPLAWCLTVPGCWYSCLLAAMRSSAVCSAVFKSGKSDNASPLSFKTCGLSVARPELIIRNQALTPKRSNYGPPRNIPLTPYHVMPQATNKPINYRIRWKQRTRQRRAMSGLWTSKSSHGTSYG